MFYRVKVPMEEEEEAQKSLVGVMIIREGVGSLEKVTTELRYLISST